jgi:integrase/recombinase XerC
MNPEAFEPQAQASQSLVLLSRFENPDNRKHEAAKAAQVRDVPALVELMSTFLRHKHGEYSVNTIEAYSIAVTRFLEFTLDPRVEVVKTTQDDLERFRDQLGRVVKPASTKKGRHEPIPSDTPLAIRTRNRYLAGVSTLFQALVWARVMNANPAREVFRIKIKTAPGQQFKLLENAEVKQMLTAPTKHFPNHPIRQARDQMILALGLLAGCRVSEIIGLNLADVTEQILFIRGKGDKLRQVPISQRLAGFIAAWRELRPDREHDTCEAFVVSLSDRNFAGRLSRNGAWHVVDFYFLTLKNAAKLGGVHALRRWFGTTTYRATKDLNAVAELLGHANLQTTRSYATASTELLRDAVEAANAVLEVAHGQG